ncbi:PAS domain S-box protein [candidate division KSB1 bacterium]|nr:MAG: PAS domain S-box protein [candidate division KSB1 bacterium]RPH94696.1 MAG: PAS domain S-box protein [candidate division KSB1 bacterium]
MEQTKLTHTGHPRGNGAALRRLAAIVESSNDAIIGKALDGMIESWNHAAEKLYGYKASEVIGRPISLLLPSGSDDEQPELLSRIGAGERIEAYETIHARKDGQCINISLTISPIMDEDGHIMGVATIARDLTLQKRAEEILRKRSSMEATALLAGGVAHDLNNLMAAVLGNAELLALEFHDRPRTLDSLDVILTSAQMAGRLAHELLAYARGGRHQSIAINPNDVVQQILGIQKSAHRLSISLKQHLAPDILNVEADPTQMNQMLHNLTMNAIEAIDGSGEITITTQNMDVDSLFAETHTGLKPGPHVVLSVSDTGCGMTADVLSHVFKPFFSTKTPGRGLGLAAVYGIVKNHSGYIAAESSAGAGACFTVYLPATDRTPDKIPGAPVAVLGGCETILVVDDEAQILMVNRRILEASGYHVLTARDGADAVRVASEFSGDIHLVVLDMAMPVMDGAQAFTLLKRLRPACKVIISSGYDLNDSVRLLLDEGADAYLQKPFRLTDLTQEVRRLLDAKSERSGMDA